MTGTPGILPRHGKPGIDARAEDATSSATEAPKNHETTDQPRSERLNWASRRRNRTEACKIPRGPAAARPGSPATMPCRAQQSPPERPAARPPVLIISRRTLARSMTEPAPRTMPPAECRSRWSTTATTQPPRPRARRRAVHALRDRAMPPPVAGLGDCPIGLRSDRSSILIPARSAAQRTSAR